MSQPLPTFPASSQTFYRPHAVSHCALFNPKNFAGFVLLLRKCLLIFPQQFKCHLFWKDIPDVSSHLESSVICSVYPLLSTFPLITSVFISNFPSATWICQKTSQKAESTFLCIHSTSKKDFVFHLSLNFSYVVGIVFSQVLTIPKLPHSYVKDMYKLLGCIQIQRS